MTSSLIIPCSQQGTNIKSISPLDAHGKKQLVDTGINLAVVPSQTKSIHLLMLNRVYDGIGLENKNGGLEIYCDRLLSDLSNLNTSFRISVAEKRHHDYLRSVKTMRRATRKTVKGAQKENPSVFTDEQVSSVPIPQTITFNEPGILFFPYRKNAKSSACCVFASLIDYLSYATLLMEDTSLGLPAQCDCIVVNNVRNFPDAVLDCEEYQRIYCCFPNTDTGRVMACTIRHRNKGRYADVSKFYSEYLDLHEYMTNTKNPNISYE